MPIRTINVTDEHIKKGARSSCSCCPIALAVNELLKDNFRVRIGASQYSIWPQYIAIADKDGAAFRDYYINNRCLGFIHMFDLGYPVKPFSFQLEIPEEFLKDAVLQ